MKKIVIGADHAGFSYKEKIREYLDAHKISYVDVGTYSAESCDYPVIAKKAAQIVASGEADKGIIVCGSGIGVCIAANKIKGIRAALCNDLYTARSSRTHNDANVLCIGERVIGEGVALSIVDIWLNTDFEGGRHQTRVDMIE
jgi:ribose 5-phosphate isomerase B